MRRGNINETLCQIKKKHETVECENSKNKNDKNILRTTTINREYLIFNIQNKQTQKIKVNTRWRGEKTYTRIIIQTKQADLQMQYMCIFN